jgi:hypothetical protein
MNSVKFYYKISKPTVFSVFSARTRWQTLATAGTGKASWHAGKTTSRAI